MNENYPSLNENISRLLEKWRTSAWKDGRLWLYAAGWFATFFWLYSPDLPLQNDTLLAIAHFYFWFRLIEQIQEKIAPFAELLLGLVLIFFLLEYTWLRLILPSAPGAAAAFSAGFVGNALQLLFLALMILPFSILLVQNNRDKKSILIVLCLLAIPGQALLESQSTFLLVLLNLVLFFLLLNRTGWLEQLRKTTLWVYLGIFILILFILIDLNPYKTISPEAFRHNQLWFTLPAFIYTILLIFVVSLIARIPTVIIFNHASLSRKLWISSLFQSTFPLLVQLITLIFIFYGFIAMWQSQNLRNVLENQLEALRTGTAAPGIQYRQFEAADHHFYIEWEGYQPLRVRGLPEKGALRLYRSGTPDPADTVSADEFLFFHLDRADSAGTDRWLYLVRIDSVFLRKTFTEKLNFLGGTLLLFYRISPEQWILHNERLAFWQSRDEIRFFPLSLVRYNKIRPLYLLPDEGSATAASAPAPPDFLNQGLFSFGQIFVRVYEEGPTPDYIAFDVALTLSPSLKWSDLLTVVAISLLVYTLFNIFIIRRMIAFGSRINKIIVQKFTQLKAGIQEISAGNLDYKIHFEGEDEFVELAKSFNRMGERLKETMAERREKDRLQFELQSARNVQLSLLPHSLPVIPGYRVAATLHTATEVGGDFYDIFPLARDAGGNVQRLFLAIGDVSGKGSPAALYMAQCMSLIRFSRQFSDDPKAICLRLNEYFATEVENRQIFITVVLGVWDPQAHTVSLVRAGHTEPIFIPGDPTRPLRCIHAKGLGIGLTQNEKLFGQNLHPVTLKFAPGDTLVLYTDGLIEASHPDNGHQYRRFEEKNLLRLLENHRGQSAEALQATIEEALQRFYGIHPAVDDHTIVIIQRRPDDAPPDG